MTGRAVAVAVLLTALAGCMHAHAPCPCHPAGRETQLFFGLSRPDGAVVSDAEWRTFLAEVVTPRFPRGLTVIDAEGQYRSADAPTPRHERTRVVILVHDGGGDAAIDDIVRTYRGRFQQESVLRVDTPATVAY